MLVCLSISPLEPFRARQGAQQALHPPTYNSIPPLGPWGRDTVGAPRSCPSMPPASLCLHTDPQSPPCRTPQPDLQLIQKHHKSRKHQELVQRAAKESNHFRAEAAAIRTEEFSILCSLCSNDSCASRAAFQDSSEEDTQWL